MPKKRKIMPENTIGGRLDKIIDYFRLNAKQFANELNISDGHLSDIRHGKRNLSRKMLHAIYDQYGIDQNWLLKGEGEMLSHQWPLRLAENLESNRYGITKDMAVYLEKLKIIYREGSTDERARVLGLIKAVSDDIFDRGESDKRKQTSSDAKKYSIIQKKKKRPA
jgi:transcriptional regulator with XRE-family HTH domain